jgi:hypothetical protein
LGLTLVGFAAVGSIQLASAKGSLATLLGAFAAFALLFSQGFLWRRGSIFPPSQISCKNRWKYLILAALLWGGLFLVWWYRVRPLWR